MFGGEGEAEMHVILDGERTRIYTQYYKEHEDEVHLLVAALIRRFTKALMRELNELPLHIQDHYIKDHILIAH